ncbi:hypothetical protein ZIOFF_018786 [Zingiber officinale]|uniref:Uncharacterized protein n=1 Tax=Zingiber officinale TaxID=94328 RepID=A0A8J5HX32_ZINOF|nr:hypothetical protein ZIOFF_018786 [Zingiber officinale]
MEFLTAVVPLLASNLAHMRQELQTVYGLHVELGRLQNSVSMIQAVLSEAQENEQSRNAVKHLLAELNQAAYEANDALDDVATEWQRCQLIKYASVRNFLAPVNPKREKFKREMGIRLREIENRLSYIASRCPLHNLHSGSPRLYGYQTTSLSPPRLLGREYDKQKLKELLIPLNEVTGSGVSVIPIVGMPGVGKTTLAQLLCNDDSVKDHFELRLWVNVSPDFDLVRIMSTIIESIDGFQCDLVTLNDLQNELTKKLSGKRYLLVLDDVWQESQEWERLKSFLYSADEGSKILVTTKSEQVAAFMATNSPPYHLEGLSRDDCWSLICQYAFARDPTTTFALDGYRILAVSKCKGFPLAAIALGQRLFREADRSKWGAILRSNSSPLPLLSGLSGADGSIMDAFSLSYQNFPQYLKSCLAYFSMIPKGSEFEKDFIIQLWMAQSFIQTRGDEQVEDIANDYFDSLMQSSFLQYSRFDHKSHQHRYMVQDVFHECARCIAAEECSNMEPGLDLHVAASLRHLSVNYEQFAASFPWFQGHSYLYEEVYKCKGLQSLLLIGNSTNGPTMVVPDDLAKKLSSLRTLMLTNMCLNQLPESIGDLKHLRCLQLQNTSIKRLPESVSYLYNLQTLGLRNCYRLKELPKDTRNLLNLRHLDLHLDQNSRVSLAPEDTNTSGELRCMPPEIGSLTHLRTLPRFIVSTRPECGLSQLRYLNNLRGELAIERLDLVFGVGEAVEANLSSKEHIHRLELTWKYNNLTEAVAQSVGNDSRETILKYLRPHSNLREIGIVGYGGAMFPTWMGDSSFYNLETVQISQTYNCLNLPPLGQLPKLKYLFLKEMHGLKRMDCSLCGKNKTRFPALETLHLENMSGLQEWWGDDDCTLLSLRELRIKNCMALDQLRHKLPSLERLVIEASRNFVGLQDFPELKSLEVKTNDDWIWSSWPVVSLLPSLTLSGLQRRTLPFYVEGRHALIRRLEISSCSQLLSLPDAWLPAGLSDFAVRHCSELQHLPKGLTELRELEHLEIENCKRLKYLPVGLRNMNSLTYLEVSDCPGLLCLPTDGFPANLRFLGISNCPELRQQCQGMGDQGWFDLQHGLRVWIDGRLVSFSGHRHPHAPEAPTTFRYNSNLIYIFFHVLFVLKLVFRFHKLTEPS